MCFSLQLQCNCDVKKGNFLFKQKVIKSNKTKCQALFTSDKHVANEKVKAFTNVYFSMFATTLRINRNYLFNKRNTDK